MCDGANYLGNAEKLPDCKDGSDENFENCCLDNKGAYDESICETHYCSPLVDDDFCLQNLDGWGS